MTHARLKTYPEAPIAALDVLWFQIAGTICNLTCTHCFISCSPQNHTHEMMTLDDVRRHLRDAKRFGVKEYYFTGGEPFMNKEIFEMTEAALAEGPVSILTNGVLIRRPMADRLRALSDASEYSLDLRISIDGWDATSNDPIRGAGTFDRILEGIQHLAAAGLNPVITVTEACAEAGSQRGRTRFLEFLREIGLSKPRLKIMPLLRIGAEEARLRGYAAWETLQNRTLLAADFDALQCTSSRMVTKKGVYVCPILLDFEDARMADTIEGAMRPFSLAYPACYTCHAEGLSCRT
jgi:MoaA/NifB/PqqE/SkfB family radical SAM enzyme